MPNRPGMGIRHAAAAVPVVALAVVAVLVIPLSAARQDPPPPAPSRPLGRDVPVYQPAAGDPERREAPAVQNPAGAVSLSDAVSLTLLHSPRLAGFAWETRAREARILQAGRVPNPTLDVLVEDLGAERRAGRALDEPVQPQTTLQLSQVIELGGKRAARQLLATRERDLAAWDYETTRIDVLTNVSRAFTAVLAGQETVALTDQTTRLVEEVRASVAARVEAGVVSPIEETRAAVALGAVRLESARARRTLEASRARLALLWGSTTAAFTAASGNLKAELAALPPLSDLSARLEQSPGLARWASELAQREATFAVARSKRVPDVAVTAGYRRYTSIGSNALVVGASIPLPLFDRNRGGIEEARSRLAGAYEERRAAQARIAASLAETYAALAIAHDEVTILRTAMLPGARQAFDAVTEGYRLGRFGYLEVLEAQRTLITTGGQYLRALADYHHAVATVERLTGVPLSGATGPSTTTRK